MGNLHFRVHCADGVSGYYPEYNEHSISTICYRSDNDNYKTN